MRNLTCSLILTERDEDYYDGLFQSDGTTPVSAPRQKGRIVTTLHKAKEVRPYVERCISIAKRALPHEETAAEFSVDADRNTDEWSKWRKSGDYEKWSAAIAPAVAARRRVFALLRDKEAVQILFDKIAPRFSDRTGGYTRVLRLANTRLGDAGQQAILEFVGVHDKVKQESQKPAFDVEDDEPVSSEDENVEDEDVNNEAADGEEPESEESSEKDE